MGDPPAAFRIHLAGPGPRSDAVERTVRAFCERVYGDRWTLEVVDARSDPDSAPDAEVLLLPTLERLAPPPRLRWTGDLADAGALARAMKVDDV